jgi:hypothetical protein
MRGTGAPIVRKRSGGSWRMRLGFSGSVSLREEIDQRQNRPMQYAVRAADEAMTGNADVSSIAMKGHYHIFRNEEPPEFGGGSCRR